MRAEFEKARRHAENTLAEVNRHLDRGDIKNPRHHQMLTDMAEKATRTIHNLDAMDDKRPYSDTNIGFRTGARQHDRTTNDTADMMRTAMEAVNKILPHITSDDRYDDDRYDVDDRRGVPGTGRGRRKSRRRYEMDDGYNMDDRYDNDNAMDDDLEARRGGRRRRDRFGRFIRSDMDVYDTRYDDRYDDDMRRTTDDARRAADEARRAADDARRTADNMRGANRTDRTMRDDARTDDHRPGPTRG